MASLRSDKDGNAILDGDLLLKTGKTVKVDGVDALGDSNAGDVPIVLTLDADFPITEDQEPGPVTILTSPVIPAGNYMVSYSLTVASGAGTLNLNGNTPLTTVIRGFAIQGNNSASSIVDASGLIDGDGVQLPEGDYSSATGLVINNPVDQTLDFFWTQLDASCVVPAGNTIILMPL